MWLKNFTIIVSKKISGISTKHEKKAEFALTLRRRKNQTTKWSKTGRPFPMKVRNNNFDHYNFLVNFKNISNFHAFSFRNTRFVCKLDFEQRCDPSGWSQVHTNLISLLIRDEWIPFKNYITSEKSSWSHFFSCPLSLYLSLFRALFRYAIT